MAGRAVKKKGSKSSKAVSPARRAQVVMSREARAAYGEIAMGVKNLERTIAEIERGLRRAEQKIEADARARIRALRKEGLAQVKVLRSREREIAHTLRILSDVVGDSWQDMKKSADAILADARETATAVVEHVRNAFRG